MWVDRPGLVLVNAILGGILILGLCVSSLVRADESVGSSDSALDREAVSPDGAEHVRQRLAAKFDVQESRISSLRDEGLGYGEIDHALTLADRMPGGITDENVGHVLDMRQQQHMGWGEIAHDSGTTLGGAKHSPSPTPPATTTPPTTGTAVQGTSAEVLPTSMSRPGRSGASAQSGAHGHGHARGPGGFSDGSGAAGRAVGTAAAHGNGHGGLGAASHGAHGGANGRAGGHK